MKIKRILLVILPILVICITGLYFFIKTPSSQALKNPPKQAPLPKNMNFKNVVCHLKSEPDTLDPLFARGTNSALVSSNIFEGLVTFKPSSTEIQPCLAESWTINSQNNEYIFKIRKNIKFHNNTPLTADSVIYSFERILSKRTMSSTQQGVKYLNMVQKIDKIDDNTIKFKLSHPYTPFLSDLAMSFVTPIISPDSYNNNSFYPIGTGPFKFSEWKKNDSIVIKKYENYWGEKPYLDNITFKTTILTSSQAKTLLDSGDIDIVSLDKIKSSSETYNYKGASNFTSFMTLNCSKPPFNNKSVRKALAYAINRKGLFETYYSSNSILASSLLPPSILGHNNKLTFYDFDIEKAQKLIKEQKMQQTKITLVDSFFQNPSFLNEIKLSLKKLGFDVSSYSNLGETDLFSLIKNNKYDILLAGWQCDNGDPDNFMDLFRTPSKINIDNSSKYSNKNLDELILKGQATPNSDSRVIIYEKIEELVQEELPLIPLFHNSRIYAISPKIKFFSTHPTGTINFKLIDISKSN